MIGIWNDWSFMIRAKIAFSKCTTNPNDDVLDHWREDHLLLMLLLLYMSNVYRRLRVWYRMHGGERMKLVGRFQMSVFRVTQCSKIHKKVQFWNIASKAKINVFGNFSHSAGPFAGKAQFKKVSKKRWF